MSVYAARMKRNLRETIEERDAILERIKTMREVMSNYAESDSQVGMRSKQIVEMLEYIESGRLPDDYLNAIGGMH